LLNAHELTKRRLRPPGKLPPNHPGARPKWPASITWPVALPVLIRLPAAGSFWSQQDVLAGRPRFNVF